MKCILSRKLMILVDFITKIFGKYFIVALKEKKYFLDFSSQVFYLWFTRIILFFLQRIEKTLKLT